MNYTTSPVLGQNLDRKCAASKKCKLSTQSCWRKLHVSTALRPAPQQRGIFLIQHAASDKLMVDSAASNAEKAAACPFSMITGALNPSVTASKQSTTQSNAPGKPIPGPDPFSLDSLQDVSVIFAQGLHAAMLRFSDKYGPVCRFANPAALNGAAGWVFLNSPENIQHVCSTNVRNYTQRYLPDVYKYVTHEKGILGSQGAYNTRHRKLCQPPFRTKSHLQKFASVITTRSEQVVAAWEEAGKVSTDVAVATQRLTLDVVGLVAFSHDFKQTERILSELKGESGSGSTRDRVLWAVNTFGEVLAQVFITPMPLLKLMRAFGAKELQLLDEAVATMRESMLGVIQERRQALLAGEVESEDLLGVLLTAVDEEGKGLTDEELWEDVHDIMGAGHETTATTLAATLYSISVHPEVEERVVEELDRVLGGRVPTYDDVEKLRYLGQCVKEVLRLYPAIPVFPREAATEDMLPSGHKIVPGDVVFMSSYALGRSSAIWDQPMEFKPERFDPEEEAGHHRFQFLPFGAGPRMCLGAAFAQMSVTLMAASLLQRLKFTPRTPSTPLIPTEYDITMNFNSTRGLHMDIAPRSSHATSPATR